MGRRYVSGVMAGAVLATVACGEGRPVPPRTTSSPSPSPAASSLDPTAPRLVVEVITPRVAAGEYAEAIVRYENLRTEGVLDVTFGDNAPGTGVGSADTGCGTHPGFVAESKVRHAYRYAGTWTVTAVFLTAPCGQDDRREYRATATVEVTPAEVPTNGPERPRLGDVGADPHRTKPGVTQAQALVSERDGYITEVRYAWGDGSPDTVFTFPLAECVDPPDHWPSSSSPTSLNDTEWADPEHRYPRPGEYEMTVTAVSTGCDGGDRQEASRTVTVTVA